MTKQKYLTYIKRITMIAIIVIVSIILMATFGISTNNVQSTETIQRLFSLYNGIVLGIFLLWLFIAYMYRKNETNILKYLLIFLNLIILESIIPILVILPYVQFIESSQDLEIFLWGWFWFNLSGAIILFLIQFLFVLFFEQILDVPSKKPKHNSNKNTHPPSNYPPPNPYNDYYNPNMYNNNYNQDNYYHQYGKDNYNGHIAYNDLMNNLHIKDQDSDNFPNSNND